MRAALIALIAIGGALVALIPLGMIVGTVKALDHATFHASYMGWINKDGEGCCNNQDCSPIDDADERRNDNNELEVRVEGQWCPVLSKHYLSKGNVPDSSVSHVCAWLPAAKPHLGPCERLLCYQPKPMS
jgi:hypothetical protein